MNKRNLFTSCLLMCGLIAGCSNSENVDTFANVSYENNAVSSNKGDKLTVGQIYDYIVANNQDEISKKILLKVMKESIDFSNQDIKNLYTKYLNDYFKTTFVENSTYQFNDEFNEELLVTYLRSEAYDIKCGEGINSGDLDSEKFSCDYSNYIEREVDYDIYMKILKIQYILNEKSNLIDKNNARRINYYQVEKGSSDNEVRNKLEEYVESIELNYNSTDDTLIKSIKDIAEIKRKDDLTTISEEYAKVSTSSDSSSSYTALIKFTTCGSKRCSLEEGKEYQEKLIMDKDYDVTKIVIDNNSEVLYEWARNLLFSKNVSDYLYDIGGVKYLVSPAYGSDNLKNVNDIILFDSSSSKYYLTTVEVIDSNSSLSDKIAVAELLVDKISDSTIINDCFEDLDLDMYDKDIKEYFESKYKN